MGVVLTSRGDLHIFGLKKGDITIATTVSVGSCSASLALGGASEGVKNKIFVATKCEVKGYTKKGKKFLAFVTNLGEAASIVRVEGAELVVCSGNIYNHYHDCRDMNYVVLGDTIIDALILPLSKLPSLLSILACQDRTLCSIKDSKIRDKLECPAAPCVLHLLNNDGGETGEEVLCGMKDGTLGLFQFSRIRGTLTWCLDPRITDNCQSGISAISCYNLTNSINSEIIVGREDGTIEILSFEKTTTETPTLLYNISCGERIESIQGGILSRADLPEIVVATLSGRIFGLCQRDKAEMAEQTTVRTKSARNKLGVLKSEIEELELRLRLENLESSDEGNNIPGQNDTLSGENENNSDFHCNTILDKGYLRLKTVISGTLMVESIVLVSESPIKIYQSDDEYDEANSKYVIDPETHTFHAEFFQSYPEGITGSIKVLIVPSCISPKVAIKTEITLFILPFHIRTQEPMTNRPFCVLEIRGLFTQCEAHSWLKDVSLEVPEKVPVEEVATLHFISVLTGNFVTIDYRKNEIVLISNDSGTLWFIQEFLIKKSTALKFNLTFNDAAIKDGLNNIVKMLTKFENSAQIESMNQHLNMLTANQTVKELLNRDSIPETDCKQKTAYLKKYLINFIVSSHRLRGYSLKKDKIEKVLEIINKQNYSQLLD
ncbi:Bardet-Biedl syndrome 7 protein homolog isoform X2 [Artemia franciscana]|uniref:Bardet-Biedl syndrome 7 protein n=1 Tax=Artemia franciscana TaxID=6661 RepID=A0AA88I8U6_ARTSF|nr:hypothetical protein QYM36_002349 [Artemia franciscana]